MKARIIVFLVLVGVLVFTIAPSVSADTTASTHVAGFGAAFSFAQTIGPIAFTSGGTIGDAGAHSFAISPSGIVSFTHIDTMGWASGAGSSFCAPGLELSGLSMFSLGGTGIGITGCH